MTNEMNVLTTPIIRIALTINAKNASGKKCSTHMLMNS